MVVLEQDRALRRQRAGQVVVVVDVEVRHGILVRRRPTHERQDPLDGVVEELLVEVAGTDGVDEGPGAPAARAGHLQVQARPQRGDGVLHRAPVGHDRPREAPLLAQDLGEQPGVLRGGDAVDLVVGAHHGGGVRLGHHALEGRQVDLAQRPLVDLGAHPHPVRLLVVGREVLEGRADAHGLLTAHVRCSEDAGQQRVLGVVLEVAAAQRRSLDVDAGPEDHLHTERPRLLTDGRADPLGHRRVPAAPHGHGWREAGRREAAGQTQVVRRAGLEADAVGAVGEDDGGHPDPVEGLGGPEVVAGQERRLLLEGEIGCRGGGHVRLLRGWGTGATARPPPRFCHGP